MWILFGGHRITTSMIKEIEKKISISNLNKMWNLDFLFFQIETEMKAAMFEADNSVMNIQVKGHS